MTSIPSDYDKRAFFFSSEGLDDEAELNAIFKILKSKGCEIGSERYMIYVIAYKCSYHDISFSVVCDESYGNEIVVENPAQRQTIMDLFK